MSGKRMPGTLKGGSRTRAPGPQRSATGHRPKSAARSSPRRSKPSIFQQPASVVASADSQPFQQRHPCRFRTHSYNPLSAILPQIPKPHHHRRMGVEHSLDLIL